MTNEAICIGNGQTNQSPGTVAGSLNCMHDQQAVITPGAYRMTACYGGGETAQALDGSYFKGPGSRAGTEREIVAEEPICMSDKKGKNGVSSDGTATTLTAQEKERPLIGHSIVRRLTPTECALLQNFPPDWCDIGEWVDEDGKRHKDADTPKYKAYGNSIALPFWAWLMRRINAQYERPATMGSLFDGVSGFCLVAIRNGIKPLWASEIEQFPIAVTKRHFGDEDAGIEGDIAKYL